MPVTQVRGVRLVYEILGGSGPLVTISPGGRRGLASDRALGLLLAEAGFRALVYDRRNTGAADIALEGDSESHEQAEDLLALLRALGEAPAYVAGCSSGARLSLLLALQHPEAVKGLLLWRVTGGAYAAKRLAFNYYEQYLEAVAKGGIGAVCETEHFSALIKANPGNRARLEAMGAEAFAAQMRRWLAGFHEGSGYPVAGLSPDDLRRIAAPAVLVAGNDRVHPAEGAQSAHRLMPNATYREVLTTPVDLDVDFAGWEAATPRLAAVFIDFLRGQEARRG
ncbi:alpha/beta fold hydrolase [Paracraurococcus lichenis]|uniref:Alpha/beta hydrolase n=1 Tax=Paracraurococcus lichenis TaxID=3064888 RepID=A0ABT9E0L4_9PROT|nr:alpha/beta hydrolase [Paracraurococcus sp. LOR1-02]MDO9709545.1 alpha/beta hydrolase [Paracraurococcus sp. LOR1-02]